MAKFKSPFPPPEGRERELLTILIEECAEVQQRATKALRFGLSEIQPGQPLTNAERLAREVGDIQETVDRLASIGVLDLDEIALGQRHKMDQLDRYLQSDEVSS